MNWRWRWMAGAIALLLAVCGQAATLQYLEEEGEGDFDLTGAVTIKDVRTFAAEIGFNIQEGGRRLYRLRIEGGQASFALEQEGRAISLGKPAKLSLRSGAPIAFTLQRRAWRMAFVWDGRIVLRAYDATLQEGKIGLAIAGGEWGERRVQPVGEIMAEDDFVREEGAQSIWQPIVGHWEAKTLRDDPQAEREEAEKSANAFSYFGVGSPRAITVAGHWFWDRYAAEAAIKPMGRGAVGLVLYFQDEKNYLLARWGCMGTAQGKKQLIACYGGGEQILAERPGGYEPGQWYKLEARVCDGLIQMLVDDELQLEARTDLFGQGLFGLYVEGEAGAFFDDVACAEWEYVKDDFGLTSVERWRGAGWAVRKGVLAYGSKGRGTCVVPISLERYGVQARLRPQGTSGAGLVVAYGGPQDYCVLRAAPKEARLPYAGKAQLVRNTPKGGIILAEAPFAGALGLWTMALSVEDGLLTGIINRSVRLQAIAPGARGGGIGFYADGPAIFDDLTMEPLRPRKGAHITREFTEVDRHPEMAEWASRRAPWVKPPEGKAEWWSKGDYFGPLTVTFTVAKVGSRTGTARAVVGADPEKPEAGVALLVSTMEKSKRLMLALQKGGQELKRAELEVEGEAQIVFSREQKLYRVTVNGQPVLSFAL